MTDPLAASLRTPLYDLHCARGARMVAFAGYAMPVQYETGVLKEHLHTRAAAGLFDISHMGQITAEGGPDVLQRLETIMPADFQELAPGHMRYSFLLNEQGGVRDDLMLTRPAEADRQNCALLVVNAACKDADLAQMREALPDLRFTLHADRALLALQGPQAAAVLARFCDAPETLDFMMAGTFAVKGAGRCFISRSGYTGEDGFEISVANDAAAALAEALLAESEVLPIGLGARDSLRLEAGLCLYGHDLNPLITPVEASLLWAIGKRRRMEGGFVGARQVLAHLKNGVARKRVGIRPEGRALAREGTEIFDQDGLCIGLVTSGGFGPSVDGPIAMGYVESSHVKSGTPVQLLVRGKSLPATIVPLPFVPHRYCKT